MSKVNKMSSCLDLALEGERLCKIGDCKAGVQYFEAAITAGTDDWKVLSAIYSQLGNAYFYLQQYNKALEYHRHDLNLARTLGDKPGEAKASGNIGNTLKILGKYDEAITCCKRHLEVSQEVKDRQGEARALYNLGNVCHAKGKNAGRMADWEPGEFPPDVKESLFEAVKYYEENLLIVRELGDRAAEGRACGNLGNTLYLLGNFSQAIVYHEKRLAIAKEFGDKPSERRAYSNLGNTHIFLAEFEVAASYYLKMLQVAKDLRDRALEAQACYSLGNTYTLLGDFEQAIVYHMQHLSIARELLDQVGEGRACWSLGNAYAELGRNEEAHKYANIHLEILKEVGDEQGRVTATMIVNDLNIKLGIAPLDVGDGLACNKHIKTRRTSMENLNLMSLTPEKQKENEHVQSSESANVDAEYSKDKNALKPKHLQERNAVQETNPTAYDDESFFELISKTQSRRIDDQRCSMKKTDAEAQARPSDEFLDLIAGIQSSRMNDQRANLPNFPGLRTTETVLDQLRTKKDCSENSSSLDDNFFDMLMKCQGSRIEEQRSNLPAVSALTVPDEDFFSLIQRVQSNRLDEQRAQLPSNNENPVN